MALNPVSKPEDKSINFSEVVEFDVSLSINKDSLSPKRNEGYYCQEMDVNRALVTTALSVFCDSGDSVFSPVKCIDVIGSTGIAGLLWKKFLGDKVNVCINDSHEKSHKIISQNSKRNNLEVEILKRDPCVLLHEMPFSFVYLDCHTDAAFYLDSLMRNVTKQGLIAISTKDDGALYGRTPEMALRNYGGFITRTFYSKELAVRLIIAGLVRSAAVHNKGLEVLCVLSIKSTITIIVRVLKGPAQANACIDKVNRLIHCNMCEDRAFYSSSIYPAENPGKLLSCRCIENTPGKVAVDLGPIWAGSLFNINFLRSMAWHLDKYPWKNKLKETMESLIIESWCPKLGEEKVVLNSFFQNKKDGSSPNSKESQDEPPSKKQKEDQPAPEVSIPSLPEPPFYFNLHKHCPKGPKMIKAGNVVLSLQKAGYRACRTHFDPLAVRTSASLSELLSVVVAHSVK